MSAATATTSSGPPPPTPLFILRAADAETGGGISLIGGGRAVSVISSNLCFVLFFLSRVFRVVFCGAASWENRVKKRAHLLKQTPQNKAETTIKYEEKRERVRVEE